MELKTQICTTKEQSERLLALGLKKETADCVITSLGQGDHLIHTECPITVTEGLNSKKIPNYTAWSLHRLIKMLTYQVIYNDGKYEPVIAIDGMAYQNVCTNDTVVGWSGDLYTDVIDCIEWLIGQEQFNQDYLKE